jgi:hypothetical protein
MMARAAALRDEASDPRVQLALLAPRWLPRLAAVAALACAAALLWPSSRDGRSSAASSLDRFVLSGTAPQQPEDPVLGALLR